MAPRLVEIGRNKDIELITLSDIERIDGEPGNFRVILRKRARYIDKEKCTGCGECQEACPIKILDEYNMNIIETKAIYRRYPQAVPNTFAIKKLGQSPCRFACPIGQKVQGYIALIREKRYEDAYHVIVRDNPFPSVCGRVCKHFCEDECTRGRVDQPVSIMNLKRFIADWAYERKLTRKSPVNEKESVKKKSKRVAIIGSGPTGLTAAQDLSDLGYSVTIFEALSEPGGMIRFGVPEYRLPKERLEWDIQNILSNGIELKTNHKIESIDSLLQDGFDVVLIATGLHVGKKLPIPGNDLPDVLVSTDFLRKVAMGDKVKLKERVLVLGGGNVAIDVARTVIRLGAKDVRLACLESQEDMPAEPWEIEDAEKEGVIFFPSRSFLEIASQNGNVTGVKCVKINFHGFDDNGRPVMDLIKGTEHTLEANTVVFAIGQAPAIPFVHEGIELTKFGTIKVDEDTLATSKQGVFAGGDVVSGIKFQYIVEAIATGHRAAKSMDLYLNGKELKRIEPSLSKVELTDEEIRKKIRSEKKRHSTPVLSVEERKRTFAETQQGYTEEVALEEANRCLECGICSECMLCVEHCKAEAINHEMPKEELIELDVGAIILSPGCEIIDARIKEELGYGRFPNVINALEFERILSASGPFSGKVV
ncbi:MAG: FAD-dependent oxidoreductase, partial [Candidatus Heimdallarchaeota archaeon]